MRHEPRGSAGSRLRCRCHGSVWRRELPPILYRYVLPLVFTCSVGSLLLFDNSASLCLFDPEAIPLLVRVIQAADSRSKENVNATENCISAVGKVMRFRPECVNVNEILPHWLGWLPLNEDKEEAVHTFDFLCDLIER